MRYFILLFLGIAPLIGETTYVAFYLNYGIYGGGNIINSSGQGLELIEKGINNGYLFSPVYTPLVNSIGPIYKIPDFHLTAYTVGVSYLKRNSTIEKGIQLSYFDLGFSIDLPETYLNLNRFLPGIELYYPVTKRIQHRILLASLFQLEYFYHFLFSLTRNRDFYFFVGPGIGMGIGKLSYSGPNIYEIHAIVNLGFQYLLENYLIRFSLKTLGATSRMNSSSFIDRRKVLVNPGKGEIVITSVELGIAFPLTFQ